MEQTNSVELRHPSALYWLFFTEMWERFSYYGMRALLIIYLTSEFSKGGQQWEDADAGQLYGIYLGLSYILTLVGGYVADRYFGFRTTVFIGGIMMAAAQFSLATGSATSSIGTFYLGLVLLVIGNGFFKPNISSMVGQFYPDGSPLKDSAYTIFYMGINIGAFFGALVCGYLGEQVGWQYGFGAAGIGMLLGVLIFYIAQSKLGTVGIKPGLKEREDSSEEKLPLTKIEKQKLNVAIILSAFSIIFWASFEQAGSSMNLFALRYTDRMVGDFEVPATWFQSVNAMFIFMLAPLFSMLWVYLDRRNINPNGPVKFAIALLLVAAGFAVLAFGSLSIPKGVDTAKISMIWLTLAYLLHTMGELCLSPVGLSFINKLSPKQFFGTMFSVWFVATGLGSYVGGALGGLIGQFANDYSLTQFFLVIVVAPLIGSVVLLMMSPLLKKWMHGVK